MLHFLEMSQSKKCQYTSHALGSPLTRTRYGVDQIRAPILQEKLFVNTGCNMVSRSSSLESKDITHWERTKLYMLHFDVSFEVSR
mmetsp:Transcript_13733/g.28190  ORF Transcript_13733/g.28190 Transcript_13733/m.28190 type:complete len:85 (-) Transcript_13733:1290-1544(-)